MEEYRTIHDPFLGKDVQISDNLSDCLRGKYACGPMLPNGEPEFGWRQFDTPPIQHRAADRIDALVKKLEEIHDITQDTTLHVECWQKLQNIAATAASALASIKVTA